MRMVPASVDGRCSRDFRGVAASDGTTQCASKAFTSSPADQSSGRMSSHKYRWKLEYGQSTTRSNVGRESEKDLTVTMTVKNMTAAAVPRVELVRYFNGDIDGTAADDLFDRTPDSVWGTQGPDGHGLALFAKTFQSNKTRIEYADRWDPQGAGTAERCSVVGIDPVGPDDYAARNIYSLYTIGAGASKTAKFVYRRH